MISLELLSSVYPLVKEMKLGKKISFSLLLISYLGTLLASCSGFFYSKSFFLIISLKTSRINGSLNSVALSLMLSCQSEHIKKFTTLGECIVFSPQLLMLLTFFYSLEADVLPCLTLNELLHRRTTYL